MEKQIHKLNEEAWSLRISDRSRSHELASEALKLAEESKSRNEILQAKLTLASGANFRMELDLSTKLLEEVDVYIRDETPRTIVARYLHQRCYWHFQKAEFQEVLKVGREMIEFINGKGLHDERAWVLTTMGIVHQRMAQSHLALNSYRQAEELLQKVGDRSQLSNVKMSIGTALGELEKKAEAQEMFKEALNLRLSVGGDFHAGMIIGNMAKIYYQTGDYPKSLLRWGEAIELLRKAGGMPFWAQSVAGRADTLRAMGKIEEAETELKGAIEESDKIPALILINVHMALARIYADSQRWEFSLNTLRDAEALVTESTDHSQLFDLYTGFHMVFKALGITNEALEYHERMYYHRERHLNELSLKRLAEWEALYDLQRTRERDRKLLEKTKTMQEELAEVINERDALLDRVSKCDTLLDEMLALIPAKAKGRIERLVRNARKLEQDQISDAVLQTRISEAHPTLTVAELRTCTMIVSGWSTKEMAERSGTSVKNIEKHRAAIRRKAGIPRSVSLTVYLKGLVRLA
ncbi:MAG: tetratricopeptide repeat protein [Flavobacteriales bacterium]|nr:tetratricopeptide repeat protein [Flavobacteriales bacterium]